jgi:hypothetical protein
VQLNLPGAGGVLATGAAAAVELTGGGGEMVLAGGGAAELAGGGLATLRGGGTTELAGGGGGGTAELTGVEVEELAKTNVTELKGVDIAKTADEALGAGTGIVRVSGYPLLYGGGGGHFPSTSAGSTATASGFPSPFLSVYTTHHPGCVVGDGVGLAWTVVFWVRVTVTSSGCASLNVDGAGAPTVGVIVV